MALKGSHVWEETGEEEGEEHPSARLYCPHHPQAQMSSSPLILVVALVALLDEGDNGDEGGRERGRGLA